MFSLITLLLFVSASSFACDIDGLTGFAPENNLRISVDDKASNGMTQENFNAIINRVENVYSPVVRRKGGRLQIVKAWDDATVNAYAKRTGSTWQINMFGGLARHPLVTDDGLMLTICHELAHHIGGTPKSSGSWASNEGQADYFGSMKCMRRILENDNNSAIVSKMNIDPEATTQCRNVYHNDNEIALCQRIAMAGKSLALMLGQLHRADPVAFSTPDLTIASGTFDTHPAAQCRLDTYFNGILCDKSWNIDVDDKNPVIGVCIKKDGHSFGPRPLCWYRPGIEY